MGTTKEISRACLPLGKALVTAYKHGNMLWHRHYLRKMTDLTVTIPPAAGQLQDCPLCR